MNAGQRDLTVRVLSKLFRAADRSDPVDLRHNQYCGRTKCWQCVKARRQFYYQIVMLTILCGVATGVVFLVPSIVIKAGAALALWTVLRAFTKQLSK